MEKHVYFVRHGESESNADRIFRGDDSLLTKKGKEQARVVGERMARIGADVLIASPIDRTRATAEHIAAALSLPIEENELFVERRRPSMFIGLSLDSPEVKSIMKTIYDGYLIAHHRHSDEENLDDLRARGKAALAFLLQHPAKRLCVVTHGNFLKILFLSAFSPDFSGEDFRSAITGLFMSNTGVSYLRYEEPWGIGESIEGKRWRIISWNDSAHLG